MIRVLLVDDHTFYRQGIRALVGEADDGVEIVAEAASGEEALQAVTNSSPDVVIMDLSLPGMSGIDATRRLTAEHQELAVLVLTMHDDESVLAALNAGARGYLLKDAGVDELVRAVRAVHAGQAIFSASIARRLIAHTNTPLRTVKAFPELTAREVDVLALLAEELDTTAIARRLGLSEKTVYNYVATILAKLRARDRADAARRYREAGVG